MLSQPKLVKSISPVQEQLNAHIKPKEANAGFIMGLNNRVAKVDKRLDKLEVHLTHLLKHHIGYKELTMTLLLALLIFTSVVLTVRELLPAQSQLTLEQQLLNHIGQANINQQPALSLLFDITQNSKIKKWVQQEQTGSSDANKINFHWPLEKQTNLNDIQYSQYKHGIYISSQLGDPIVTIGDGQVLYSGNAIAGYGNLIIIQHRDDVISVYGNNYSNYVKEGQHVSQGELIAATGESTRQTAKLYFEIRYKGKAEDPLLYFNQ